jgi:outer membrane protein TolC
MRFITDTNLYPILVGFLSKRIRRSFKIFLVITICFNLFLTISLYSQPDSLYHYLEVAAKNNPTVLQKFSEYQAALQKIPQVGSLSDPELSMGVFLSPMELMDGKQVADIRLMQMLPWFGVLRSAKDEMSMMAKAKFELFRDSKLQVYYDVQRNWYELYKIQKNIAISEKSIEILKTVERLSIAKYKSSSMGSSSGSLELADIYRIQIEAGDLDNSIALLKSKRKTSLAQFNSYLNRPPASPVFVPESLVPDSLGSSLIIVSDSMQLNNPMLSMLEYEKQSIEAKRKMVSLTGFPMVGLGLNYSVIGKTKIPMGTPAMNGMDMIMPMVTVTLPVYRKKHNAMVEEADLLKTAAMQNYQATSNALQNEYYQAVQLYEDAQRRIRLYDNQYQLASKSLDLILKSFSVSTSALTDVLRIQQQTLEYESKHVEAIVDYNIAIAWLRRLGNLEINGNK